MSAVPDLVDASGAAVRLTGPARRIVSLIPSITEILFALGAGDAVVGCTIYCTEPAEGVAGKARVGGEKNPRLDAIRALAPDLVIANVEENLPEHVAALRSWGIPVFVTYPRTVAAGIAVIRDLGWLTGASARGEQIATDLEAGLAEAERRRQGRAPVRVFYPIWRRPYMTINQDTYASDMLAVCGGINVFAGERRRYPEVTLDHVAAARPEVILLPDEPYRFRQAHVADFAACADVPAVRTGRVHLVDGKLATWYGPRIAHALALLPSLLDPAAAGGRAGRSPG
jgi:ABC-type Fe3+-hydroxamate transport system substrate-binding protein